ncbi:MAG: hypothetical protein H8E34_03890 [Bacteroidetes bacterium]|nr:hypothetical protein [Bacteroidota bacterium]MBL6943177.1 hypothetical protein [Bacteroidales bacterium]
MEIDPNAKILLDADVLIHFIRGNQIGNLHRVFNNELILIDIVFNEVFMGSSLRTPVENLIKFGFVTEMKLDDAGSDVKREYYRLTGSRGGNLGKGESAIMAYCRYNDDVLASSNLTDISNYCEEHGITYLTTMDFLAEAFRTSLLKEAECDEFIKSVKSKGSKLIKGIDKIRDYHTR